MTTTNNRQTMQRKSMEPFIKDSVNYYNHQIEGIRKMAHMRSFLLADDMGLGKSLQAITVFAIDVKRGIGRTCLIVCPASLKQNWKNEFDMFTGGIEVRLVSNAGHSKATRMKQIEKFSMLTGPKVLVVNYEQVVSHLEELNRCNFDVVIFDEAHMLKSPKAKRTLACHKLITHRAFLLTGSPILNHVNDLWSLCERVIPGMFGSYYKFLNRYAVYGGYQNKQITSVKNEQELRDKLQSIMIRRLKEDVLDLPEVQFINRSVELLPKQKKLYNEVVQNMQLTNDSDPANPEDIQNALTKFLRLKQICGTSATVTDVDVSGKLDTAVFDAETLMDDGHRVVAFTQFRGVQKAYVDRLNSRAALGSKLKPAGAPAQGNKFPVYVLNGDVPIDERQEVVRQWSLSAKPGILVCIFSVAGVGLNMTAARHGQFLDKLFTPALNKQAVDRMHRIGSDLTQPVQIFEYLCKDTAEERVEKILKAKKKVSDQLVETDQLTKRMLMEIMKQEAGLGGNGTVT